MIINLLKSWYFKLAHKKSGRQFDTFGTDEISYDDEKFEVVKKEPKKQTHEVQATLFN